jgi:hypothetical protein
VVLVVGAAGSAHAASGPDHPRHGQAVAAVRELAAAGARPRAAATVVAKLTGLGANELYRELTSGSVSGQGGAGQ